MAPKKETKKAPENGIVFPPSSSSERSTTTAGRNAFAAAIGSKDTQAAAKTRAEKNWRWGYVPHCVKAVELSAESGQNAVTIAQAGLDYCHQNFEFIRDGEKMTLDGAMKSITAGFHTGFIKGDLETPEYTDFQIPYNGQLLKGEKLAAQVDQWVQYGTIEPTTGDYIKQVALNKKWCDLSDKYFVLLGAGSAMGPFLTLMKLGANVIAIDLDRPHIWKRIIRVARESAGTLTFPMSVKQEDANGDLLYEKAGCNLFTQTPEIKNWIVDLYPEKELVIGSYAYLDGEAHVRVSLAMDAIAAGVCAKRPSTGIAYLNTPTQCFMVPEETAKDSMARHAELSLFNLCMMPLRMFAPRVLDSNYKAKKNEYIVDGLVVAQGPNYALAKTIQHWRAVVEKQKGHLVSSNIAPSTATVSVVSNRSFAWAYGGYHYFAPMEIFQQETSNAVMCALLINDVRNTKCNASPSVKLSQPYDLFKDGSFHGGVWRQAYTMQSTGEIAAILYFYDKLKPFLMASIIVALAAIFMF